MKLGKKGADSPDELKGKPKVAGGRYHVAINHVDESFDKDDAVLVTFQVLEGTTSGQIGKTHTQYYRMKRADGADNADNVQKTLSRMAWVCGVPLPDGEEEFDLNALMSGKQLCIAIEERQYVDKKTGANKMAHDIPNFGEDFWAVDDPAVADVAKNAAALKLIGSNANATATAKPATNGAKATQQPATTQQQPVGAAAGGADDWSDLMT